MRPLRPFAMKRLNGSSRFGTLSLLVVLFSVFFLWNTQAVAQVVAQADFEDGTTDGWGGFAGAQVALSTVQANTGTHSLLTTNRTQTFQGPGIDLTSALTPGQPYFFKIAVRLSDSTPGSDSVKVTMRSTINGSQSFATVASATVTNTGWVLMQGVFASATTGLTDLFLFVEDDTNASEQYYIDTFSVAVTSGGCANPPDNSGFSSNFETGTSEGWVSRGGGAPVVLTPTMNDAHTGNWSLLVTGRTANLTAQHTTSRARCATDRSIGWKRG